MLQLSHTWCLCDAQKLDAERNKWRAAQRRRQKAAEAARPKPPVTEELVMAEIAVADEEIAR